MGSTRVRVVLRYDDLSARPVLRAFERRLLNMLVGVDIGCSLAAIPFVTDAPFRSQESAALLPLSGADVESLLPHLSSGRLELAQHGYSHRNCTISGRPSEFRGVSYDEQLVMLQRGRRHLESLISQKVNTFVPPWNSFDANTVRVLDELQFRCLSASSGSRYPASSLAIVPHTCVLRSLERSVELASRSKDDSPIVVAAFHSFDFEESGEMPGWIDFSGFTALVGRLQSRFGVEFCTLESIAASADFLDSVYAECWLSTFQLQQYLVPAIRNDEFEVACLSSNRLRAIRIRSLLTLSCSCVCSAALGGSLYFGVARFLYAFSSVGIAINALLICGIVSVLFRAVLRRNLSYKVLYIVCASVGLLLGRFLDAIN